MEMEMIAQKSVARRTVRWRDTRKALLLGSTFWVFHRAEGRFGTLRACTVSVRTTSADLLMVRHAVR